MSSRKNDDGGGKRPSTEPYAARKGGGLVTPSPKKPRNLSRELEREAGEGGILMVWTGKEGSSAGKGGTALVSGGDVLVSGEEGKVVGVGVGGLATTRIKREGGEEEVGR